jgi:hypothetical protein
LDSHSQDEELRRGAEFLFGPITELPLPLAHKDFEFTARRITEALLNNLGIPMREFVGGELSKEERARRGWYSGG